MGIVYPKRLAVTPPSNLKKNTREVFCCPTSLSAIEKALSKIKHHKDSDSSQNMGICRPVLTKSICYGVQYLEFLFSQVVFSNEEQELHSPNAAGLHNVVNQFQIHACAVTTHSILEGIGSFLYQRKSFHSGRSFKAGQKIPTTQWRPALSAEVSMASDNVIKDGKFKKKNLEKIAYYRDKVHLDQMHESDETEFGQYTYASVFVLCSSTIRQVLTYLCPAFPERSVLREEF